MNTYTLISTLDDLSMVSAALQDASGEAVGVDCETTGLAYASDRVRLLTLAIPAAEGQTVYVVDAFTVDPSPLWESLSECILVGHNLNFDLPFLNRLGFTPGRVRDTMILSQILYASAFTKGVAWTKHGLKDCVQRELGVELSKDLQKSNWSGPLSTEQFHYAAADVQQLRALHTALTAKLKDAGLERVAEIESTALPCIAWMSARGVPFDRAKWAELAAKASADVGRITAELDAAAPKRMDGLFESKWNWNSPTIDVKEVLALLGHPVEFTGDEVLAKIDDPVAALLREYRDATKRQTTYGIEWAKKHVAADDRVYARWSQLGAHSGRMSCGDPNMQNLPRGEYRRCFSAPSGRVLVKADYSQIELRIAAKVSGDATLAAAYAAGEDLHTLTAKNVLGIQDVTKQRRQLAKAINFGLLYGMGAKAFKAYAKTTYGVELSESEANQHRNAFFKAYPGLQAWHRRHGHKVIESRTLAGRRVLRVERFTEQLNLPVQGSGADGLKAALALLWRRRDRFPTAFPILAVHDEIVVEADEGDGPAVRDWLKAAMVDAMAPFIDPIPVEVECRVGRTWGGD